AHRARSQQLSSQSTGAVSRTRYDFTTQKPRWSAFRLSPVERDNMDCGFSFHDLSRAMPDDQHADERVAKTVGKNGRASCLVYGRPGKGHPGNFARLRGEAAR